MHSPINFHSQGIYTYNIALHRTFYQHPPRALTAASLLGSRLLLPNSRRRQHLLLLKQLRQLAILVHRDEDIASAHKLLINVQLRDRRPVRELLDA